jgi:hypothetical protein
LTIPDPENAETVNRATEIRLLAERQMGEFLKAMPKAKGGAQHHSSDSPKAPITAQPTRTVKTIREIGLTHNEAERAQKLADIPADEFRDRIVEAKIDGRRLSISMGAAECRPLMGYSVERHSP